MLYQLQLPCFLAKCSAFLTATYWNVHALDAIKYHVLCNVWPTIGNVVANLLDAAANAILPSELKFS